MESPPRGEEGRVLLMADHPVEEFLLAKEAAKGKEAGFLGSLWKAFAGGVKREAIQPGGFGSVREGISRSIGEALPGAVAGASLAAIGAGTAKGLGAIREKFRKQKDYKAMMQASPGLNKRPAAQVQLMYNSLRKLSPVLASDPVTAGSFIDNAMELSGDKAVMPTQTAKLLAEAQKSWSQGKARPGRIQEAFAPSRWVEGVPGPEGPQYGFGPQGPTGQRFGSPEAAREGMQAMGVPAGGFQRPDRPFKAGPRGMEGTFATPGEAEQFLQDYPPPKQTTEETRFKPTFFSGPVQPSMPRQVAGWEAEGMAKRKTT